MYFQNTKMAVLMSQAQVPSLDLYPVSGGGQNWMPRERCNREICDIVLTLLNVSVHVRKFSGCFASLSEESSRNMGYLFSLLYSCIK